MRSTLALLLALAAFAVPAAADPPADAFCVILIEPLDGFRLVRYTIDEETTLAERAALWPTVDRDNDTRITLAEADAFRQSQVRFWRGEEGLGGKAVTLEAVPGPGTPPLKALYATTWRQVGHVFHHQEYQLPDTLTRVAELETQEVREFRFDPRGDPERLVLSGGRAVNLSALPAQAANFTAPRAVIEYVVLRAPAPWLVERVQGRTYNGTLDLSPDAATVDIPAFDTQAPYTITYVNPEAVERHRPIGIPGAGLLGTLAMALGACAAARRRRT